MNPQRFYPKNVAIHDMTQDGDFHPILLYKEKDIIEFLNKDNDERTEEAENSDN